MRGEIPVLRSDYWEQEKGEVSHNNTMNPSHFLIYITKQIDICLYGIQFKDCP
jgi:hypothetical protein